MRHPLIIISPIVLMLMLASCKPKAQTEEVIATPVADLQNVKTEPLEHHHVHKAPHDGMLIEIGDEFAHVELVLDSAGKLTAYILDGEAENPIRLNQPSIELVVEKKAFKLAAVENALTGETVGDSSEFSALIPQLKNASSFGGTVSSLNVKGASFKKIPFQYSRDRKEEHP